MPRYPKLNDREWLREQYVEKTRSQSDIAEEVGCTQSAVSNRIRSYGFDNGNCRYPELNDEQWLEMKHHEENVGLSEMADEIGCTRSAVGYALRRNDIEVRRNTLVNQLDEPLSDRSLAIIEGELLGDGCIPKPHGKAGAAFSYGTACEEYRDWLSTWFNGVGFQTNEHEYLQDGDRDGWGENMTYRFVTSVYFCLMGLRKRWYPNGEKRVPDGFELSPLALQHWYIGDGSYNPESTGVTLYTDGFPEPDAMKLVAQFGKRGIDARVSHRGSIIVGKANDRERFFEYMAPLPDELHSVYGYKWPDEYL